MSGAGLNRWLIRASVFGVLSVIAAGCGNEEESRPAGASNLGGDSGFGGAVLSTGSCDDDDDPRECKVYHHQANGVVSCYSGVQFCENERWTDCLSSDTTPASE